MAMHVILKLYSLIIRNKTVDSFTLLVFMVTLHEGAVTCPLSWSAHAIFCFTIYEREVISFSKLFHLHEITHTDNSIMLTQTTRLSFNTNKNVQGTITRPTSAVSTKATRRQNL